MASESEHIECANRTHKTIEHLLADHKSHSPWIAIAAFYKRFTSSRQYLPRDRKIGNTSNHDERDKCV